MGVREMHRRKGSLIFVLFGLIGAAIGISFGEWLLIVGDELPNTILMALYFSQMCLFICGMFLLAEYIAPEINSINWKLTDSSRAFKALVPSTLALMFVCGFLLQFIYGLSFDKVREPQDVYLAIDISSSMVDNDPNALALQSAKNLVNVLSGEKRVSITTFATEANNIMPLTLLSAEGKKSLIQNIETISYDGESTDIVAALNNLRDQIDAQGISATQRKSVIILLTDAQTQKGGIYGFDQTFKSKNIALNSIVIDPMGLGNPELKDISSTTGGKYMLVDNSNEVVDIFSTVYNYNSKHYLVGERFGKDLYGTLYPSLRILFLLLLGILIGINLGVIFNNRFLATTFMIGGGIAGLYAGILLEVGMKMIVPEFMIRAGTFGGFAFIIGLSTVVIGYKDILMSAPNPTNGRDRDRSRGGNYRNR
jgi:Ca-activated chloride channel family protein